jgi:hypothetical protein
MSWFIIWLYVVMGQLTVLLLLDEGRRGHTVPIGEQRGRWAPYGAAIAMVIAWPAADLLLQSFQANEAFVTAHVEAERFGSLEMMP